MHRPVRVENFDRPVEGMSDKIADRMVHKPLGLVAELPRIRTRRGRRAEHGRPFALIGDVTEFFVHAIAQHHAARGIGGFHEIVRGAGRKMVEKDVFGGAAAEQHRHAVFQLFLRHQEAVFGRPLDGVAEGAYPARDD